MRPFPVLGLFFSLFNLSVALYTAVPRWAQAVVVINDALFVYGGKTDQYNTYGYSAAPWNNDLLFLSLSTPFDPSNPPWQYLSGSQSTSVSSQAPALAWHSLSAFNSSFTLIFGGNTGPLSSIVLLDNDDSALLLNLVNRTAPNFLSFPNNWAGEPQRRMRHATASRNGKIYIIGGEAADGSGNTFSSHFVFNPSLLMFIQLPSQNAPPGIFGHAAVILIDGRLLVFGGISQGQLVPLSTVWILDTTQSILTWTLASIDASNLPSPRASFAFVLLNNGRILIQGGTDAAFQSNFGDGWILNPFTNPMTWTPVPALSRVGPRRDHFALCAGPQVIFGFGFGNSAPIEPTVQIYNVDSSSFQPTFSPMTAPPAFTTLPPDPSQTITNPPGSTQTSGNGNPSGHSGPSQSGLSGSRTASRTGDSPSGTSTPGGPGSTLGRSKRRTTAIIIGAVLGALGLAGLVTLVAWYLRRRRSRSGHAFNALNGDDEDDPHSITAIRIGSAREKGPRILTVPLGLLSAIGIGRSRRYMDPSRRDILADEDRSFQWVEVSREGSGGRSSFGGRSTRGLSNAITESLASIRNLARGAGSASHSRAPSATADWEKMGGDPFSPEVALMAEGLARDELPEQTRDVLAGPSQLYADPFPERDASSEVLHHDDSGPGPEPTHAADVTEHHPIEARLSPVRTALPLSVDFVPLSPLLEQTSQNSLSKSASSHNTNSDHQAGSGSSHGTAVSPRPSSILDPNPPPSQPIRRSNSWWARFTKTPLLERRGTESSTRTSGGFIDFRDPKPPPRLVTIEETTHSQGPSDASPDVKRIPRKPPPGITPSRTFSGTPTRRLSLYRDAVHGRSASSLQTANTETLERLGGTMDIIQRDGTLDSHYTPPTGVLYLDDEFGVDRVGVDGTPHLRALFVRGEPSTQSTRTETSSISTDSPFISTPFTSGIDTPTSDLPDQTSSSSPPEEAAVATAATESLVAKDRGSPPSPGVAERVRAFERRMSRESELPPPPTNTRRREERTTAVAPRPSVRYGLVPRASLFVANPDGSRGSDGA